jgi:hypothetical protein
MLGQKELASHLGPHPRPISSRQRRAHGQARCRIDRREAFGHLDPKRAQIVVDDPERRPQPRHVLKILIGEVGSF